MSLHSGRLGVRVTNDAEEFVQGLHNYGLCMRGCKQVSKDPPCHPFDVFIVFLSGHFIYYYPTKDVIINRNSKISNGCAPEKTLQLNDWI